MLLKTQLYRNFEEYVSFWLIKFKFYQLQKFLIEEKKWYASSGIISANFQKLKSLNLINLQFLTLRQFSLFQHVTSSH
jgi:hypothetical protein